MTVEKMYPDVYTWYDSLHRIPHEDRGEIIGELCTALHILYSSLDEGMGTLSRECPLCRSGCGIPCTKNYGSGGDTKWPHLERVRLARPGTSVDTRQEQRLRHERVNLEYEVLEQLERLDHLASLTDNTPKHHRRQMLMMKIATVLGVDSDQHLRRPNWPNLTVAPE